MLLCKTKSTKIPACFTLFPPALLHKQDFHDQTSIHWTAGQFANFTAISAHWTQQVLFPNQKQIMINNKLEGMKKNSSIYSDFYTLYNAVLLCLGSSGKQEEESSSECFPLHLRDMEEKCFIWSVSFLVFSVNNRKPNQTSADSVIHYETLYFQRKILSFCSALSLQLSK